MFTLSVAIGYESGFVVFATHCDSARGNGYLERSCSYGTLSDCALRSIDRIPLGFMTTQLPFGGGNKPIGFRREVNACNLSEANLPGDFCNGFNSDKCSHRAEVWIARAHDGLAEIKFTMSITLSAS